MSKENRIKIMLFAICYFIVSAGFIIFCVKAGMHPVIITEETVNAADTTEKNHNATEKTNENHVSGNKDMDDEGEQMDYTQSVVIDPGHGGEDLGIVVGEQCEKDLALQIALQLKALLEKQNIKVFLTRAADDTLTMEKRSEMVNLCNADFCLSLHLDSDSENEENYGVRTYYDDTFYVSQLTNGEFAFTIETALANSSHIKGLGIAEVKEDAYDLQNVSIPAAYVSLGYMTNVRELYKLTDEKYQRELVMALYRGILNAYEQKETKE